MALQMGATIHDLEEAELCYAPQFGSAKDPVNFAGMVAAGLDGIEADLPLEEAFVGNAYTSDSVHVPASMAEALQAWESSDWITQTFGAEVQDHYTNMARVELADFGSSVTDWERYRSFERL